MSVPSFGSMIIASARLTMNYAERLSKDIPADQFAQFARTGDTVIEANHPAFIFGHLGLYPCRIVSDLGNDASAVSPSAEDESLFSHHASCLDDRDGSRYPSKDVLVERFMVSTQAAIEALQTAEDDQFRVDNPNEQMRPKFPTVGAMHGFYLGGHVMLHMGQLSTWRRVMGMGPA